jgi:transposase
VSQFLIDLRLRSADLLCPCGRVSRAGRSQSLAQGPGHPARRRRKPRRDRTADHQPAAQEKQTALPGPGNSKKTFATCTRTVTPADAAAYLKRWCTKASRSGINAFTTLARRIGYHFDGISAAIHHGISNSLLECVNAGIRLIQRRAHGYANLITMIYLCHGGVPTRLPSAHSN